MTAAIFFVPAASGYVEGSTSEATLEKGISYTDTELKELYHKYGVKENDLKFAKKELPNYLEGTILDSDLRVIASENEKPPEGLKEGKGYDRIITHKEMFAIIDEAREKHIKKYGVDPANSKTDVVNGYILPKEEVDRLVNSGKIKLRAATPP